MAQSLDGILGDVYAKRQKFTTQRRNIQILWRKERDSNPRNLCRLTRLAVAHNRPLCHLSPHLVNVTKWGYGHQYLAYTREHPLGLYLKVNLSHLMHTSGGTLVDFRTFCP